jgi:hypothetical protein
MLVAEEFLYSINSQKENNIPKFNPGYKSVLASMLLTHPLVDFGKEFGYLA